MISLCACVSISHKTGKGVAINGNVLERGGPGHDVDGIEYGVDTVLVLAGIELIFFLVAGTVLCFGFRMRTMLITHRCFSCC